MSEQPATNKEQATDAVQTYTEAVGADVSGATTEIERQLADYMRTSSMQRTGQVIQELENRGVGVHRLFADQPANSWNPAYNFANLNVNDASRRHGNDPNKVSRQELTDVINAPGSTAVDRLRARYLLDRFGPISRGKDHITTDDIRQHVRTSTDTANARVVDASQNRVRDHADLIGRYLTGQDRSTTAQDQIRRILTSSEYRPGSNNYKALVDRLTSNRTDGLLMQSQLNGEATSTGGLTMRHLTNLANGRDLNGTGALNDPLKRLAAATAIRRFAEVDTAGGPFSSFRPRQWINSSSLGASDLRDYASVQRRAGGPEVITPAPATTTGDRTVTSTTGPITPDRDYNGVRPDAQARTVADDIRRVMALSATDPNRASEVDRITRSMQDKGILGNETRMTQVLADLNRTGHLGRFLNNQLGGSEAGVWGWTVGHLNTQLNDASKTGMQRLAALGARQNFQRIEGSNGRDLGNADASITSGAYWRSWVGSDTTRLSSAELARFESNRTPVAADTTSIYPRTQNAINQYTELANRLQRGETVNLGSTNNTIGTDLINPSTTLESQGQADALLASITPEAAAQVASNQTIFNQLADRTSGRITRASLEAAIAAPTGRDSTNLAKLTAKALLRDASLNTSRYDLSSGMTRTDLQSIAGTTRYEAPRLGVVSEDLVNKSREELQAMVTNPATSDTQAAHSLAAMFQTNAPWNSDYSAATIRWVGERDGQKYVYTASMTRMPGDRNTYQLTLNEQRARIDQSTGQVVERNGQPIGEGTTTRAMLATARFDPRRPIDSPDNRPTLDKQRGPNNQLMQSFRTPEWENKINGTEAALRAPTVTTGDAITDANSTMEDRVRALAQMQDGATVMVNIDGQQVRANVVNRNGWVGLAMPRHQPPGRPRAIDGGGFLLKARVQSDGSIQPDGGQWATSQWRRYESTQWSISR